MYCLLYSQNSSNSWDSLAPGLIDFGARITSSVGAAARIGKNRSIAIEAKSNHQVIKNIGRKVGREVRWAGFLDCMEDARISENRVIVWLCRLAQHHALASFWALLYSLLLLIGYTTGALGAPKPQDPLRATSKINRSTANADRLQPSTPNRIRSK